MSTQWNLCYKCNVDEKKDAFITRGDLDVHSNYYTD